jgi:rare lipoprotein A
MRYIVLTIMMWAMAFSCEDAIALNKQYRGNASWYNSGNRTAGGQVFNKNGYSVAHRTLPFGTVVTLVNPKNGRKVRAIVNDRGPYSKNRIIDVSYKTAKDLGFVNKGITTLIINVE